MADLNLTITGTPTYNSGNAKFGSYGLSGGAIGGNLVDSFLSATGADGGALTTGTIEAWVKTTNSGSFRVIASHGGWWYIGVNSSNNVVAEYGGSPNFTDLVSTVSINDGAWHHVALVITAGAGSLYVDGAQVATSATARSTTNVYPNASFIVGTHVSGVGTFMWPGSIDEVRLSNVARYSGTTYTVPTAAFTPAADTMGLYHLENNSNDQPYLRTNLIKNPSFETATTGYVSETGTLTRDTVTFNFGSAALKGVAAGANRLAVYGATGGAAANADSIAISVGQSVAFSAYVNPSNTTPIRVSIQWFTSSGTFLSNTDGALAGQTANTWTRMSVVGTAPTNAAKFGVFLYVNGAMTVYTDNWLVEAATSTVGGYFDGSSTASGTTYAWTGTANASTSTETLSTGIASTLSGSGTLTSALRQNIASSLSGSGTLTSAFTNYKKISAPLSGSGTLTSALHRYINSNLSGSGTLTSVLGQLIHANFSGSGTLTSSLHRYIQSNLSGSGTLSSALANRIASNFSGAGTLTSALSGHHNFNSAFTGSGSLTSVLAVRGHIASNFYGSGYLQSTLAYRPHFTSAFSGQGILYSELFYTPPPAELGTTPLGKLVSFSVSTSATPINPAEGAGGSPAVSAGYLKGLDPEFMLGEDNTLSHGSVGTYKGEVVRLSLPQGSDVATVGQDTLLTLLNADLTLFPFIDAAPTTWTAPRAIDYWTQQAGVFYDRVPGDCIAYASGFGHTDSYGADTTARFYEKLTGGTTSTTVLNNRSVKTLGTGVTGTTALHELPKGSVPVSVPQNRKLVASIGLGLRGTGRTTTVSWNMEDAKKVPYVLTITATSAGLISAAVDGVPIDSTSVAPNAEYRINFSLDRVSTTAVVGKLSVHTDDLAGTGTQVYLGAAIGLSYAFPAVSYLTSIVHASTGGSGTEMLRWGTYLTVATAHPVNLPVTQKALAQSTKVFGFVSGFAGNVWAKLNEYCAITRQDIRFIDSQLAVGPRSGVLAAPKGNFSTFTRDSQRRDKYKQVAVINKRSKAVSTDDAIFWRADSVFQVAAREVFETTVQTKHSILNLVQPVAVGGIEPFPYKQGGGQYVVTGADGYIIAPAWWNDNGGKVEVSLTGKEGEIAIKITAPSLDTVRAPYRISEGAADRPALYVAGSGILNDPLEVHVGTGAKNAKEGFDHVFDSPFIAGVMETYDTAAAMAAEYSASVADVSFEIPNDFNTPSRFGQFPAGALFTDGVRNYRIKDASQTHARTSGNAIPHTTIGAYVASYPPGATIADEKARHTGRTIKQFNLKPLRGSDA